ncbi:MAG TPA: SET domain-containing protein [Panacibacter sp.]|nr:SET domain-containing protein [Panacibacter sp.]HNP46736.1 SET domain-containing protein [Panacibacter sp.]
MILPYLIVAPSGKEGRGVFTSKALRANTVIEISPVIVLSAKERKAIESTKMGSYIFEWGKTKKLGCVALGYVSLYNHDYTANCEYEMDFDHHLISIKTVRGIKKGEELFINYNASPNDKTKLWFDAK